MLINHLDGDNFTPSRHTLADLKPEAEKILRTLLASGKPFDTGMNGAEDVPYAMFGIRSDGVELIVTVSCDDGKDEWDKMNEAIETSGYCPENFTQEEIRQMVWEADSYPTTDVCRSRHFVLPVLYDDVLGEIFALKYVVEHEVESNFNAICAIVRRKAKEKQLTSLGEATLHTEVMRIVWRDMPSDDCGAGAGGEDYSLLYLITWPETVLFENIITLVYRLKDQYFEEEGEDADSLGVDSYIIQKMKEIYPNVEIRVSDDGFTVEID